MKTKIEFLIEELGGWLSTDATKAIFHFDEPVLNSFGREIENPEALKVILAMFLAGFDTVLVDSDDETGRTINFPLFKN